MPKDATRVRASASRMEGFGETVQSQVPKSSFFRIFSFFFFLWRQLQHMEVPEPGVDLELQLPAYTTAMEIPDP